MSANTNAVNQIGSLSTSDRIALVRVIESLEATIAALTARVVALEEA
jgi:hypothetical protein